MIITGDLNSFYFVFQIDLYVVKSPRIMKLLLALSIGAAVLCLAYGEYDQIPDSEIQMMVIGVLKVKFVAFLLVKLDDR